MALNKNIEKKVKERTSDDSFLQERLLNVLSVMSDNTSSHLKTILRKAIKDVVKDED